MSYLNINPANQQQAVTAVVNISGQWVAVSISGQSVLTSISGQLVLTSVSGQQVLTSTSGQVAYLASGSNTIMLRDVSGLGVSVRGKFSGNAGNELYLETFQAQPDVIKTIPWQIIPSLSGGIAMTTRAYDTIIIQGVPANSGNIHLGGSGSGPHATRGYVLTPGSSVTLKTTNAENIYAYSVVSGDRVATIGYSFA